MPGGISPAAALGRGVRILSEGGDWREIVGVTRHVRHSGLDEQPQPEIYAPFAQIESGWQLEIGRAMDLAVSSASDPQQVVTLVRRQIQAIDPELPLSHVRTLDEALALSVAPRVFSLSLLGAFALAALLLCALGVYGVISYATAQRSKEIGVRIALGARPAQVLQLIVMRGLALVAIGTVIGAMAACAGSRLLQGLLYSVSPRDPLTFGTVVVLLGGVGTAASCLPAWRAMRLDPVDALRDD